MDVMTTPEHKTALIDLSLDAPTHNNEPRNPDGMAVCGGDLPDLYDIFFQNDNIPAPGREHIPPAFVVPDSLIQSINQATSAQKHMTATLIGVMNNTSERLKHLDATLLHLTRTMKPAPPRNTREATTGRARPDPELSLLDARLALFELEDGFLYLRAKLFLRCAIVMSSTRYGFVFWAPVKTPGGATLWVLDTDALNRTMKIVAGSKFSKATVKHIIRRLLDENADPRDAHKACVRATLRSIGVSAVHISGAPLVAVTHKGFNRLCRITRRLFPAPPASPDWAKICKEIQNAMFRRGVYPTPRCPVFGFAYTTTHLRVVFGVSGHVYFDHQKGRMCQEKHRAQTTTEEGGERMLFTTTEHEE